jgi:quercetin dioxygenase-like cupin family protein
MMGDRMLTMTDLAKLRESNLKIDAVNKRLDALGHMLVNSSAVTKFIPKFAGFDFAEHSIEVTTVFQTENITVTLGIYHIKNVEYPEHCHKESIEYLIVMKGVFLIKFGKGSRIISKGECVSLDIDCLHTCTALENESEIIAICVPPELAYTQSEEKL